MSNTNNNTSLDFLDISSGIVVSELEVPKIESKKRAKKATKSIKLLSVVRENVQNSLSTFKERISEFTKEQQVVLLKEWESKRKELKSIKEKNRQEMLNMRESFRTNVRMVFETLWKSIGKSHTLIVKSPIYNNKSYKFTFKLKRY
jgi:hypothetical protein